MKVKYSVLVIMLIFLAIGTVSAEENVTSDNLAVETQDINVTFDEQMWKENLSDIDVELPDDAEGDFCIKIDDEIIYNQTITNKTFKVPIKLPNRTPEFYISIYPPIDCRYYKVNAFYNNVDLNINKTLKVMFNSPDYNLIFFPDEVLKDSKHTGLIVFPRSANGLVEFYIDDKLFNKTTARPTFYWEKNPFSSLPLGNHTFKVVYHGDSYYKPFNKTFNFTVVNVVIDIPKIVNIGHDDCIAVSTIENVKGTVKVYIDGNMIVNQQTDGGSYVLSLENYIKYTNHEIKVEFTSKNFSRNKTQLVNMTYGFDVWPDNFIYGEDNFFEIILPDTLNNKLLSVSINGVKYPFKRSYLDNNAIIIDDLNLPVGNYTLNITYEGDEKFYPLSQDYNFTVNYGFNIPWGVTYKDSTVIYLNLPTDASGNLVIYVDGKYFKSAKMNNGHAEVKIDTLAPGRYNVTAEYVGDDYYVNQEESFIYVTPKITVKYKFRAGENKYVKLQVPKSTKGYVVFEIDDKRHKVKIVKGVAKYSLKNLKPGVHDIFIDYYGADGYEDLFNWREITVKKPLIKLTLKKVKIKKFAKKLTIKAKLKVNGKIAKGKKLKFKFKGKTYTAKTNKNGIAKITIKKSVLKKLKVGKKVKYRVTYNKKTVKRAVKVRR